MESEYSTVEKPKDWPINAREHDLELINKAIDEFETNVNFQ